MAEETPHSSRLERFKKTFPEHEKRIKALRRMVASIPDSEPDKTGQRTRYRPLFKSEMRRVLRNRELNGDAEVERRIAEQEASLNEWISCLDEEYSDKQFTFLIHQVIAPQILGARDSIGDQPFERRTPETYAPYPRMNREALASSIDILRYIGSEGLTAANYAQLTPGISLEVADEIIKKPDFLRLYEIELHRVEKIARENAGKTFENIPSDWKIYEREKGAHTLVKDLSDKGTGWCIAGYASAWDTYLSHNGSRMHVCFRGDKNAGAAIYEGKPGDITQIRGSAPGQHMDGDAAKRAKEYIRAHFKESDLIDLDQKFEDTLMLTEIIDGALDRGARDPATLKTSLRFLYEIDRPIRSFGYGRDRRIDVLRKGRDVVRDAQTIFGIIAQRPEDVTPETKAYIGPISADLWKKLGSIEHIYTAFPEVKIIRRALALAATTPKKIQQALKDKKVYVSDYAKRMVENIPKKELKEQGPMEIVALQVKDLFTAEELKKFGSKLPTTKDIFDSTRLQRLGLERVPATVASEILVNHGNTLLTGQWEYIGMETIPGRGGDARVFHVERGGGGALGLGLDWAGPGREWGLDGRVVLRPRK
ncbi:hypothetical protein HY968_00150 [Candidatus Kaiserbacteria bacterium]|nr:hypothetical protein [Candidatus Kaiserbacteria bacterium]